MSSKNSETEKLNPQRKSRGIRPSDADEVSEFGDDIPRGSVSMSWIFLTNIFILGTSTTGVAFMIWGYYATHISFYASFLGMGMNHVESLFHGSFGLLGTMMLLHLVGMWVVACRQKKALATMTIIFTVLFFVLLAFSIAWIVIFALTTNDLDDKLEESLAKYETEFSSDEYSININVLQILFSACGVYGIGDYSSSSWAPVWQTEKNSTERQSLAQKYDFDFPLTCCKNMDELLDDVRDGSLDAVSFSHLISGKSEQLEKCNTEANRQGIYPKMRTLFGVVFGVGSFVFLVLTLVVSFLLCCTCNVLRNGPKEDNFSGNYNKGKIGPDGKPIKGKFGCCCGGKRR